MSRLTHQQPQINPADTLLCASYLHEGLSLDLYGTHSEEFGYTVTDVAIAGSKVSLYELTTAQFLTAMDERLAKLLPTGEHLRNESRDESRISTAMYDDGGGI